VRQRYGIPEDEQRNIFGEFYRLAGSDRDHSGGVGLGLAIVDRLCRLLDHPVELKSQTGRGSQFSVSVPLVPIRPESPEPSLLLKGIVDTARDKLVVVIDDDVLVLEGGLGSGSGC
jgi:Histidine kinase-, DNA gyrase B-, and HSP90-like ATPase